MLIEEHLFAAKGMAESATRYVFVFKEEGRWRVPAYLLTRRILFEYGWSDGAEFLESSLLGYSENEIAVWQSRRKEKRLGWEGLDFFLVIDERDAEAAAKLGYRALDFTSNDFSAVAFFSRSNRSVSQAAFALVPERKVLMRAGLKWKALAKIFDQSLKNSEAEVVVATVSQKDVVDINRALTTNLHALSPDGWL